MEPIRYPFTLSYTTQAYAGARCAGSTRSGDLVFAVEHARYLLNNDPARSHATIDVTAVCVACDGAGRVAKRRFAFAPCKACKGEGLRDIQQYTVRRDS
jgi:hypothetical protein